MTQTVLITGSSGKIGRSAAKAFALAGWQVRPFRRGGDLSAAAQGCDVIVNGMNPPHYKNWAHDIPKITNAHVAAARASGATVIVPGNVYNFGQDASGVWDAATPQVPVSRKGAIRVAMEQTYRDSGVRTLVLRAGNFLDPEGADDVASHIHLSRLAKGVVVAPGRVDARQSWCYLPDWARAAAALMEQRTHLPMFADIPFAGQDASVEDLAGHLTAITGKTLRVKPFPWWGVRLTAPVWPFMREVLEMRYLWDHDHSLSPVPLQALLPDFVPTPMADVLVRRLAHQGKAISTQTSRWRDA